MTDKLTATVGGRYFNYHKSDDTLGVGGLAGLPLDGGTPTLIGNGEGHSRLKANLSYKPTKDALLYALWSQGFRLGRPTAGLPDICSDSNGNIPGTNISIASTRRVRSDSLDNYEIGAKFVLFEHRMAIDTAIYHIDWQDLPVNAAVAGCGALGYYTSNAGGATSEGAEFEASVFVVEGVRLDFGAGYTKAELSKDASGLGVRGDRLPGSPKVNANLAAQYDFNVVGHKAFVRADSFYVGKFYADLQQTPISEAGDYINIDARAGVTIKNLSVELFVRNLANKDSFAWRSSAAYLYGPFYGYRLRPRTVGIQLGYAF